MKNNKFLIVLTLFVCASLSGQNPYTISANFDSSTVQTIASAGTIAPTVKVVIISGTAAIATITPPPDLTSAKGGCIDIDATGAWTTTTAGNIQATMTASAGTGYRACWYGTKWLIK